MNAFNKTIITLTALSLPFLAQAQEAAPAAPAFQFGYDEMLWLVVLLMASLLLFLVYVLQKLVYILKVQTLGAETARAAKRSLWEKLLSLKPLEKEKDLVMDHAYDGIYELDNPTPPWFNFLFYGTILFGVVYLIQYHVIGDGNIMEQEYAAQMAEAEKAKAAYLTNNASKVDETNVTLIEDKAQLTQAATVFREKCAACHGDLGEGKNGPNLTDEYWLHGGSLSDVFKTIKYGVPQKGMIPWEGMLKPEQIQLMASYILSIKGTVPAGQGKAPEGTKTDSQVPAAAPSDSTKAQASL